MIELTVKIELIVSQKAGCWTIVCTRLLTLTFPSAAMSINITTCSRYSNGVIRTCYSTVTRLLLRKYLA